jgi:glycosyltransferase involved in cell wall biosynthesis/SAM-dependent methyltransferase
LQNIVSVIIPCFNQCRYLHKAIRSVTSQTYGHYQIIVVDDGSEDDTKSVAASFPGVEYVFQTRQGLSAARNKGIDHSTGDYLVFLDADDWLHSSALETNLNYLLHRPELAFVSGAHKLFFEEGGQVIDVKNEVKENNYLRLLEGNYIKMIATVMFRKWVFDTFRYDTSLKVCEDYDLFLKIARKYPVIQHTAFVAYYRKHAANSSRNYLFMLETVLRVLNVQKQWLVDDLEKNAVKTGMDTWKLFYTGEMYHELRNQVYGGMETNKSYLKSLKKYNPKLYFKLMKEKYSISMKRKLKKIIPGLVLKTLRKSDLREMGRVDLGDLRRTKPFSEEFGYDRGGPVDRYYIENFLQKNEAVIRGRVLEVADNDYTMRFGSTKVTQSDILHIDESNPNATIIADLSNAPQLEDDRFDCIVLTQTLQFIYNAKDAIKTCYRILKPGGALLMTVPGITQLSQDQWSDSWHWSFTRNSISKILLESFSQEKINIEIFGNVLAASAFLYGLGLPELNKEQMDVLDPNYQVIITSIAYK